MEISRSQGIPTYLAADRLAEERIARVVKSRNQFLQNGKHILSGR
jgi:leucine dehydrogenase